MDQRFDIIVVGGGGSGLACAVSAAEHGARVLLLERQGRWGGTSGMAVGSLSGAGSRLQAQAGIRDDWTAFVDDMAKFTDDLLPEDNARLRAWLAQHAAETIDWLADWGVVFAGPFAEPPHRVHRMHNAVPGAASITRRLIRACRRLGVGMVLQADVRALHRNQIGRVQALTYVSEGHTHTISAERGIVLASGDFSGSTAMRQQFLRTPAARALPINPDNQGQMFELAHQLGAKYVHMGHVFGPQMRFPKGPHPGLAERMPDWPWLCRLASWFFAHAPDALKKTLVKPLLMSHMSPSEALFQQGARLFDRRSEEHTSELQSH